MNSCDFPVKISYVELLRRYPLVICFIAIENDPVEIVDLPS
jgi:hypothetical protein